MKEADDFDWDAEVEIVEEREKENTAGAKKQRKPLLNFVGPWNRFGYVSLQGGRWTQDELWDFTTRYKTMCRLSNVVNEDGKCILGNELGPNKLQRCLDIGCDWGHLWPVFEYCFDEVYGIEPVEWAVEEGVKKGRTIVKGIMEKMPYEDGYFDLVHSNHVLEHGKTVDTSLAEIIRVTKIGGWSIHTIPCRQDMVVEEESEIHKSNLHYEGWAEAFEDAGFFVANCFFGWNHNQEDFTIIARWFGEEYDLVRRRIGDETGIS